ncbi:hypothetical protein [Thermococcus sp.]
MAGRPGIALLRENLLGDGIERIEAVLNATTTFILSKMEEGKTFEEALTEAQSLEMAERDPSGDVLGIDAGYKATILHCVAFHPMTFDEAEVRGIDGIRPELLTLPTLVAGFGSVRRCLVPVRQDSIAVE